MPGEREVAQALLSSYEPSLRERAGNAIYDIAQALGMGSTANRMRNEGTAVLDFIPGVGEVLGVNDAMNDFNAGNYGMAAAGLGLTALGAVPGVGDAASRGIRAWTGGVGDPVKAASDKGAWFSEAENLAREYAHGGGQVRSGFISPSRTIEFRHAEQSRSIGDIISTALEGASDDIDIDAVTRMIDDLRGRYGDVPRPLFEYWNNDKGIVDFFRALGYDSISAHEKSNMASKTWSVLDPSILSMEAVPGVGDAAAATARRFLPSSASLNIPRAPSIEELSTLARMEDVPVSQLRGSQSTMNWDGYNRGEYGEPMFGDFSLQPVVARRNDGEYIVFDGHHRSVSALNEGVETIPTWVIDASAYDPANAGRTPSPDTTDLDELMRDLGL